MRLLVPALLLLGSIAKAQTTTPQPDSLVLVWQRELAAGVALQSASFLNVTADEWGNTYALGMTETPVGETDLLLVKYNAAGQEVWHSTYDGPLHSHDYPLWSFTAPGGGALIAGRSGGRDFTSPGLVLLRYNEDGSRRWVRQFAGEGDTVFTRYAHAVMDADGSLFVQGERDSGGRANPGSADSASFVMKISPDGDLLWEARLPGKTRVPLETGLALSGQGDVVVCVTDRDVPTGSGGRTRPRVFKYSSHGEVLWETGHALGDPAATAAIVVAADEIGSRTAVLAATDSTRHLFLLGDSGQVLWRRAFDRPQESAGIFHVEMHITVDSTLWVCSSPGLSVRRFNSGGELSSEWWDSVSIGVWRSFMSYPDWSGGLRVVQGIANDEWLNHEDRITAFTFRPDGSLAWSMTRRQPMSIAGVLLGSCVDRQENQFIVTGAGEWFQEQATIMKASSQGALQWVNHCSSDGSSNESVTEMTKGQSGDLYLTGTAMNTGGFFDIFTARLSSHGDLLWVRLFDGPAGRHDLPVSILTDEAGNVYVGGYVPRDGEWHPANGRYLLLKYSPSGDLLWSREYTGTSPLDDRYELRDLHRDRSGRLWLAGSAGVVCYDSSGAVARTYPRDARAVTSDGEGRVFVAERDTLRSYAPGGSVLWATGGGSEWYVEDMASTGDGGVIITSNYYWGPYTSRYDSLGARLWSRPWGGNRISMDEESNVHVVMTWGAAVKMTINGDSVYQVTPNLNEFAQAPVSALSSDGTFYIGGEGMYSYVGPPSFHMYAAGVSGNGAIAVMTRFVGPLVAYTPQAMCAGVNGEVYMASDGHHPGMQRLPIIQKFQRFIVGVDAEEERGMPTEMDLAQNYPNPFNPVTTIRFAVPIQGDRVGTLQPTSLQVFDLLGRKVATLVDEVKAPGNYSVRWDASAAATGVYFYRLMVGEKCAVRKMVVMK